MSIFHFPMLCLSDRNQGLGPDFGATGLLIWRGWLSGLHGCGITEELPLETYRDRDYVLQPLFVAFSCDMDQVPSNLVHVLCRQCSVLSPHMGEGLP